MATHYTFTIQGDARVGKSSLLLRFTEDAFGDCLSIVGDEYRTKSIELGSSVIKALFFNRPDLERFRSLTALKYKGAQGIFLVYDVTYRESFEAVRYWFREIRQHAPHDVLILLLGNKTDLEAQRIVSFDEGKALADELGASFMECSAKTSANVEAALISLAVQVRSRVDDSTSLAV